ncbi:hypothetical protein L208DRAFT_1356433 [Tricholoma matsutake]|nr:hypothetical protein L208DRAFT_1356433 [Tricholoma matsutake 945]
MATITKKPAQQLKRVFKSAARIPVPLPRSLTSARSHLANLSPLPGELPFTLLRLQVLSCSGLLAKDRNGSSDPYVVVSILNNKHQTPVAKRTLNPTYQSKDATFDFPIYLSLADRLGVLELVVWDKDYLGKDYLGEAALPLDEWFTTPTPDGAFSFDDAANTVFSVPLLSTRANTPPTGAVQIKLGFVAPQQQSSSLLPFNQVFDELVKRSSPSLVSAPPTEGVGTIRSSHARAHALAFQEDGGLSSDAESIFDEADGDSDFEDDDDTFPDLPNPHETFPSLPNPHSLPIPLSASPPESLSHPQNPPQLTVQPSSPGTPTPGQALKTPTSAVPHSPAPLTPTTKTPSPGFKKIFPTIPLPRRLSGLTSSSSTSSSSGLSTPAGQIPPTTPTIDPLTGEVVPGTPAPIPADTEGEKEKVRKTKGKLFLKSKSKSASIPTTPMPSPGAGSAFGVGVESRKGKEGYSLEAGNDIVGIVMLEIQRVEDLPKLRNMTRTGWDMDPFVVISFGKKVFRTRVIRHSLNPVFDEKLLFHVRRYETSFSMQLTVLDWDKLSSNDHIGDVALPVTKMMREEGALKKDPETGLYDFKNGEAMEGIGERMLDFSLPLTLGGGNGNGNGNGLWGVGHSPTIKFRAIYQPYDALRQRFWREYLKQYDTANTESLSHLELTSMLDSLNSTLTRSTIASFFTRFGKSPKTDKLTLDEAVQCLEAELGRPVSEKRRVGEDEGEGEGEGVGTPMVISRSGAGTGGALELEKMDFSGRGVHDREHVTEPVKRRQASDSSYDESDEGDSGETSSGSASASVPGSGTGSGVGGDVSPLPVSSSAGASTNPSPSAGAEGRGGKFKKARFRRKGPKTAKPKSTSAPAADDTFERVINVGNCPLCQRRPRMNDRADVDIVTHLAVCASQDWNKVDRIVVGHFVTASEAQRKWYTRVLGKVSGGGYRLGANSANIIVQNRMTGQLEEEKMHVHVRLGIRLLYKGASSRMEGGGARHLLKSLSVKQGFKYDDPASAREISTFIEFHKLNVDEFLDPVESFKTFNEFFYRKLKPSARPTEKPDDPYRLVSAADCRFMAFTTVDDATHFWIKGREFTVARLLGEAYKDQAERYVGGALAIFRLAPQDYHRFHSPVEGTIGPMTYIPGEYYTVNPQAIRTALDVYGENARKVVPIDSPQFGKVMAVCVGAMMVGSINTTVQEGDHVSRGQEFGYFAFGGSTIVILFEKGVVQWDEDLLINGRASLETFVRVGMGIGTGTRRVQES